MDIVKKFSFAGATLVLLLAAASLFMLGGLTSSAKSQFFDITKSNAYQASSPPFIAQLTATTHRPAVNTHWNYQVKVLDKNKHPIKATITAQLVDTIGGVHSVQFGRSNKDVTNIPFKGTFKDYLVFPPESEGFRLVFRTIIKANHSQKTLTYFVITHK